jgi:acetyl-CoA C-acetyltransferase/acetyl-CoA acyltransferase
MTEVVIVSTARTPIGKAYRGALNNTEGPTMAGHVIGEAVRRAKVEPGEVEDVVMGCAMQQGTTAMNVARKGAIRAGLPVTVAGTRLIGNARRACRRSRSSATMSASVRDQMPKTVMRQLPA